MTTTTSTVGGLTLPLPAGAANSAIDDPTVTGLAAYFRHWLRADLNTKLANLAGTAADACPAANVFPWNPTKPGALYVRGDGSGQANPFPALYVWSGKGRMIEQTTLHNAEEREIGVLWLFDELSLPGALVDRAGLCNAVAKSLQRAIAFRGHPTYSHNGGAAGIPIAVSLGLSGRGILLTSCEPGMLSPIPVNVGRDQGSDQPALRAYPSVMATLTVWERVEGLQPSPGDIGDVFYGPTVGGDPLDPLALDARVMPGF